MKREFFDLTLSGIFDKLTPRQRTFNNNAFVYNLKKNPKKLIHLPIVAIGLDGQLIDSHDSISYKLYRPPAKQENYIGYIEKQKERMKSLSDEEFFSQFDNLHCQKCGEKLLFASERKAFLCSECLQHLEESIHRDKMIKKLQGNIV